MQLHKFDTWTWLIIITLVIKLQESTLIRPKHPTGVVFMFAYLALFVSLIRKNNTDYGGMPKHTNYIQSI